MLRWWLGGVSVECRHVGCMCVETRENLIELILSGVEE